MKICRSIALLGALLASTVPAAFAASPLIKANVPFAFLVGARQMPAGEYTVTSSNNSANVLYIHGPGQGAVVLSSPLSAGAIDTKETSLVFKTKGTQRYLVGVRMSGEAGRSVAEPVLRPASINTSR